MSTPGPQSDASDSEPDAGFVIRLGKIQTIGQLYQSKVLQAAAAENVHYKPNSTLLGRVCLFQGDITRLGLDSIVNAANKSLLGGGGVDGAIHAAAGPKLVDECRGLNGCLTGQSKITRGYDLPAAHVIHTVGPIYSSGSEEESAELLASCYRTSLQLAVDHSLRHIAFPSISTGIYGYPIEDATRIALDEVRRFCESEVGDKLDRIIFVVWSNRDKGVYESLIPKYFPEM